jgi:acyl dehydratase
MIGVELPPRTIEVEKWQVLQFARAIGESNPISTNEAAARAAGYRGLVAPPTFAFCLNMMAAAEPREMLRVLGIDPQKVLHGEQSFTYRSPICAGDVLTFRIRVTDIYVKKGGALEFVVQETAVTNPSGQPVVNMRGVTIIRHGSPNET